MVRVESSFAIMGRSAMKAVVYRGAYRVVVEEVEDARIEDPRDAVVKVTSAGISG
jgi:glutathione-independent formaldehyde dehydrogenase